MDVNKDLFIISAEAELQRFSRLMNKSSKAYYSLKDSRTDYARSVFACYRMNKTNYENTLNLIRHYKIMYKKSLSDYDKWLENLSDEERQHYDIFGELRDPREEE